MKLTAKKSFTLIEVMVVAAIVCIIGAMMLPIITKKAASAAPTQQIEEVFRHVNNSLYVYSFVYSNRTYLVSSQGGIIEVRKDE